MKQSKFKIGDKVSHRPDLYNKTESVVKSVTRCFDNQDGGLAYLEDDLPFGNKGYHAVIKNGDNDEQCYLEIFKRHENTFTLEEIVKFNRYVYVVSNEKMNTIISEKHLKKVVS